MEVQMVKRVFGFLKLFLVGFSLYLLPKPDTVSCKVIAWIEIKGLFKILLSFSEKNVNNVILSFSSEKQNVQKVASDFREDTQTMKTKLNISIPYQK